MDKNQERSYLANFNNYKYVGPDQYVNELEQDDDDCPIERERFRKRNEMKTRMESPLSVIEFFEGKTEEELTTEDFSIDIKNFASIFKNNSEISQKFLPLPPLEEPYLEEIKEKFSSPDEYFREKEIRDKFITEVRIRFDRFMNRTLKYLRMFGISRWNGMPFENYCTAVHIFRNKKFDQMMKTSTHELLREVEDLLKERKTDICRYWNRRGEQNKKMARRRKKKRYCKNLEAEVQKVMNQSRRARVKTVKKEKPDYKSSPIKNTLLNKRRAPEKTKSQPGRSSVISRQLKTPNLFKKLKTNIQKQ